MSYRLLDALVGVALGLVFLVVLLAFISGCGDYSPLCTLERNHTQAQIVNGEPSTDRRATVLLRITTGYCTGTVIGPHTVMTAEHCIDEGVTPEDIVIDVEDSRRPVESFLIHPTDDLALVYTLSELPGPIARLYKGEGCYPGFIAQGWGVTEEGKSWTLNERVVYDVDGTQWVLFITEGACFGDSGSSLYVDTPEGGLAVTGVSSRVRAYDCTQMYRKRNGATAKYTNTLPRIGWIEENTK